MKKLKKPEEKEFTFNVYQPANTCHIGTVTITASSEQEAMQKVLDLKERDLDDMVDDWELSDDTISNGFIEVYNEDEDCFRGKM